MLSNIEDIIISKQEHFYHNYQADMRRIQFILVNYLFCAVVLKTCFKLTIIKMFLANSEGASSSYEISGPQRGCS